VTENRWLRDFSLLMLERAFPRTFSCLTAGEKARLSRDFGAVSPQKDLKLFPEFLERRKWPGRFGFLPDLARLEYSLKLASLAPELHPTGFEKVPMATEPDWYSARFRFDPALQILLSDWPLAEVFERPKVGHDLSPGAFLVFRGQGRPQFRSVNSNELALIQSLSLGVPLGKVLDRPGGPDFDAFLFHRWIESGLLRAIDWAAV
jgi:hypothetical protein